MIKYGAVIRTTGENELLFRTLSPLELQTLPPDEILIVLPEGLKQWETNISSVRFAHSKRVWSPKGPKA